MIGLPVEFFVSGIGKVIGKITGKTTDNKHNSYYIAEAFKGKCSMLLQDTEFEVHLS